MRCDTESDALPWSLVVAGDDLSAYGLDVYTSPIWHFQLNPFTSRHKLHHIDDVFIVSVIPLDAKTSKRRNSDRLTISLGEDQRPRIAEIARQQRTSEAAVIRWAVDRFIADQAADQPKLLRASGTDSSSTNDR